MTHHFKKTTRIIKGKVVWRCENCDSECVFSEGTTEHQANEFIAVAYPKLLCMRAN